MHVASSISPRETGTVRRFSRRAWLFAGLLLVPAVLGLFRGRIAENFAIRHFTSRGALIEERSRYLRPFVPISTLRRTPLNLGLPRSHWLPRVLSHYVHSVCLAGGYDDRDLKKLTDFEGLTHLYLVEGNFSQSAIAEVMKQPSLKKIFVASKFALPPEQVTALRKRRPDLDYNIIDPRWRMQMW